MSFGLCNSQAAYQRGINEALKEAANTEALVDDTLVHSRDFASHVTHLEQALGCLEKAGIQLRVDKYRFAYPEVQFLGHVISGAGRKPLPSTLLRIAQCPSPTNKREVRRFMGLINWYREYVPGVAGLAEPLHRLTRKGVPWEWSSKCEDSFMLLKDLLTREFRTLAFPKWNQVFYLTDHNPLAWLRRQKETRNKFARWLLELETYDYEIQYRSGVDNGPADFLSRIQSERDIGVEDEEEHFERFIYLVEREIIPIRDRMGPEQRKEGSVAQAIQQLEEAETQRIISGPYRNQEDMRLDGGGRLCRKLAVVVPKSLQRDITSMAHRLTHAGTERSFQSISDNFFWPKMKRTIEQYCPSCPVCAENKRRTQKREPLRPMKLDKSEPRHTIATDISTLPWSSEGYRYLLTIVDLFSKFIEVVPMYDQSAGSVRDAILLVGWIYRLGILSINNAPREKCRWESDPRIVCRIRNY